MNKSEKYRGVVSEIDPVAIQKLYKEYLMTNQEIADLTWTTKANINRILHNGSRYYKSWIEKEISDENVKIFKNMLEEHSFAYQNIEKERIYLIKNDLKGKLCLLWYDAENVHCLFDEDIPEEFKSLAIKEHMDKYSSLDYKFLAQSEVDSVLKQPYLVINAETKLIFEQASRGRKLKKQEYAKFLGFHGYLTDKDTNRDSKIISFLDEHVVDGLVYLSSAPENQWFRNYVSRCRMSIDEFINFFGYKKSKYDYNYISERKNIKYGNELKKYIIKPPNIVYFTSQDKIFHVIENISKLNKMSIEEYVFSLGYIFSKTGDLIKDLTDEINKIIDLEENEVKKKEISQKKIERNHKLIDKLKRIYEFRCQLCSEEQSLSIVKIDGTKYVEVHHIKNLAEEYDEEGTLDRVNNLIVVCPNHHKMLHYHKGGYRNIKQVDGMLVFENGSKETIPILINKHLKSD